MVRIRGWGYSEKNLLIEKYDKLTIKELELLFPNRSRESINNKIKRLKKSGEIQSGKDSTAIKRSYKQRGKKLN